MSDFDVGMKTRREVLGDEHVDRAAATAGSFGAPWQEFITRYAWGGAWSRPGLDRRTRSAITLAALISMRAENEIGMHVRAALRQRADRGGDHRDVHPHRRVRGRSGVELGVRGGRGVSWRKRVPTHPLTRPQVE